jgi:membrane-bound lytic murein transglycosylase D
MNGKKPLAVVISTILSLAGATGCSTTSPNVKQTANYQQKNKMHRAGKLAPQASNQQTYNEIYAAAVQLGFDKQTMNAYYQRRNAAKQRQKTLRQRNNWNNRYRAKYKRRSAMNTRRYTLRPRQRAARSNQQYANLKVGPPIYARQVVTNNRRWVRPAISRPQVQNQSRYRPRSVPIPLPRVNNRQYNNGGNMWNRVKGGFRLGSELHNPTVQKVLRQYASNPARLNRILSRSTEYMHFILHELNRRGMPTEIALLPMVESAFKNKAISRSGAAGMWQFMPATGRDFGLHRSRGFDARMDVFASTRAALTYLQKINRQFNGDWYLTLAAYNVGQNRIHRERAKNRLMGRRTDYWSLSLPRETREYVPRLLAYKEILLNPHRYGVRLPAMSNNAVIAQTIVNRPIDLRQVAHMAGLPASTLTRLNPNFKNGITNPRLSRKVALPRRHAGRLNHAIRSAPTVG